MYVYGCFDSDVIVWLTMIFVFFFFFCFVCFFQAEDGIRYLVRSRGLGDVYKRQLHIRHAPFRRHRGVVLDVARHQVDGLLVHLAAGLPVRHACRCLLYTSDAADERSSVDLGGRRIIKKKKDAKSEGTRTYVYEQMLRVK